MNKSIKGSAALIIPIAAILIGVGGFVAWKYLIPEKSIIDNLPPKEVLKNAIQKIAEVKSLGYNLALNVEGSGLGFLPAITAQISVSGAADRTDKDAPKGFANIVGDLNMPSDGKMPVAMFPEKISLKAESRLLNKEFYFKGTVTGLPEAMMPKYISDNFDKWIKVDAKTSEEFYGYSPYGGYAERELFENREFVKKVFLGIAAKHDLFSVSEKLGTEKVSGRQTNHYKISLDKEGISAAAPAIIKDLLDLFKQEAKTNPKFPGGNLPDDVSDRDVESFRRSMQNIDLPEADIWVGIGDNMFYQLAVSSSLKQGYGGELKYKATLTLSDFDESVTVEVPAGAKDIKELVKEMSSNFGSSYNDDYSNRSFGSLPPQSVYESDFRESDRPSQESFAVVSRNMERESHVNTILNAIGQRMADNRGDFNCPAIGKIPEAETRLGKRAGNYNIYSCLVPTYMAAMPLDPQYGNADDNGYTVRKSSNGRVTVSASYAEQGEVINVTR